jgi:DpnII restriction endonuclease
MDETDFHAQRLPTEAFGYVFTHVPEHVREDLVTLRQEAAVYSGQWVEELGDFRHVRIALTDEECKDFARRSWAFELWMRAGRPQWARDAPGIDQDVAHDADSYVMHTSGGESFGPPYHCFAAFLGEHLEALTCGMLDERRKIIEFAGKEALLHEVRRVIHTLTPTIRSFNTREKGLSQWTVSREDDVRDLLYVMLRPLVFDLSKEEAVPSRAGMHKFVDLCSKAVKLMVEVKWIDRCGQWKRIVEQIHVDTQSYVAHPACETLIFVVVDSIRDIPDPRNFEYDLSGQQTIDGKSVNIRVFVAEP